MSSIKQPYARRILVATTMLMWFSIYSYQANFTPYLQRLSATTTWSISSTMIGLITGSYGFTQMILRIPLGILSDKLKTRKLFIIIGIAFTFLSAILFIFEKSVATILIARASAGIAASTWVNFTVLYSSYFDADKSVNSVSIMNFFSNISQLGGILAGAFVISYFTDFVGDGNVKYYSAFLLAAVAGLAAFILSFEICEDREKLSIGGKSKVPFSLKQLLALFTDKTLISVSLIGAVSQLITFGTLLSFTPKYANEVLHTNAFQNGILMTLAYIPTAFGSLFLSKFLSGKVKEYKLVCMGMIFMAVNTVIIPAVSSYSLLVVTQIIAGIGKGISFPLLMGLSIKKISEDKRGTAMGIFQAVYGFGMFIGPVLVGIISDLFELSLSFILLGGICFATAVASYFILKKLDLS